MKNFKTILCLLSICVFFHFNFLTEVQAQDTKNDYEQYVHETFGSTRLINAHSIETVEKRTLDVRITHRFGDIAGEEGGISTLFGLDNVTDVRIAFEYGVTDQLTLGFGRSKGTGIGPAKLLDGYAKYRLLKQRRDNKMPISLTLFANTALSTTASDDIPSSNRNFEKFAHRMSYDFQLIIARKFGDRFALQLMPNFLHRNLVTFGDENNNFSVGVGFRLKITKTIGIIADYYYVFSDYRDELRANDINNPFINPLSIGLEFDTGGHVFHLNFSNATDILENTFIPFTQDDWAKGQFRLGFNISRGIKL